MSRIKNFDTLPEFVAAPAQGAAIAASFPIARQSAAGFDIAGFVHRLIARMKAARNARRTIEALSGLSERQLKDIGLSRANIVSTAIRAASVNQMIDVK